MRAAPAVLDAPVSDAAVIPKVAIEKVSPGLAASWVCDGCAPALAATGKGTAYDGWSGASWKGNAYDGWSGASCKGNAYGGWNGGSSRNAAWTGIKHRWCTCEGYAASASIASASRNCGDDYLVIEAPGLVTKSALHPSAPESVAMFNVPEAAEMVNLAPTISKASAAISMIEEIGDGGLDSPSSRSPITPPAMPLIAPGFPQPGTPASAVGAISAPGDPDDELPMLEVSDEG